MSPMFERGMPFSAMPATTCVSLGRVAFGARIPFGHVQRQPVGRIACRAFQLGARSGSSTVRAAIHVRTCNWTIHSAPFGPKRLPRWSSWVTDRKNHFSFWFGPLVGCGSVASVKNLERRFRSSEVSCCRRLTIVVTGSASLVQRLVQPGAAGDITCCAVLRSGAVRFEWGSRGRGFKSRQPDSYQKPALRRERRRAFSFQHQNSSRQHVINRSRKPFYRSLALVRRSRHWEALLKPCVPKRFFPGNGAGRLIAV